MHYAPQTHVPISPSFSFASSYAVTTMASAMFWLITIRSMTLTQKMTMMVGDQSPKPKPVLGGGRV